MAPSRSLAPGRAGGTTSITVTHYGAALGSPVYSPFDQFVMRKQVDPAGSSGDQMAAAAAR